MVRPNLFSYATSELSQDAFICWLLSWVSPEYKRTDKDLYQCATKLVQTFFDMHCKEAPKEIRSIEVIRQDKHIDVLCIINGKYAIIIEDKTGTKAHSNQLARYFEDIKKRDYEEKDILRIYFKTEDQGDGYPDVNKAGFKLVLRADILQVLNSYSGNNAILTDYRDHLQSIEDQVESYKSLPIDQWKWYQWVGFYLRLQKELDAGNWDYVPNQRGGFLGFWWHSLGNDECKCYLQLEKEKLCFKIGVENSDNRGDLRAQWHQKIIEKAPKFQLDLAKPGRFGNGKHMTVCICDEYRESTPGNLIDMERTVCKLKNAEALLKAV